VIHVFEPGETINLEWNEFVFHPGYFRISFDEDGDDDFVDPASYNDLYANASVLVDNLFPHEEPNTNRYEFDLTLPNVECENCTIQLIQMMTDKPPYEVGTNDIYYNCLDVTLKHEPQSGPSQGIGDFNEDNSLTTEDIELLVEAIRTNGHVAFDLTDDRLVDLNDLIFWIVDVKQTWIGDANLDGEFNRIDLVDVLRAGEFDDGIAGNSTWATGDWTGDAEFDRSDLILALQDGGYEAGPRATFSAVPEPTSLMLILTAALIGAAICSRRARA
jgi:hypothetical protein